MQDIQTVSEAFIAFMETQGLGTFGENLYLSQVPADAPDSCWWTTAYGGIPIQKNGSGEIVKQYFINVHFRSKSAKEVERSLYGLEEILNCTNCVQLEGYEVIEIGASQFPQDQDLDNVERRVGFLQANIKIYKKEC